MPISLNRYSRTSLSRTRLFRITAYLEVTIWYLFNMKLGQQVTKQCGKEEKLLLRSTFSSFPHYFIYIFLTAGVKLHIHLLNVVVQFIVFLTLSTLICRSTDISKCFSESLGIRDNGCRLYLGNYRNYCPGFRKPVNDLIVSKTSDISPETALL